MIQPVQRESPTPTTRYVVLTIVLMSLAWQQHLHGQEPQAKFRAGVDLVSLNVTVNTPAQQYVSDLGLGDFVVLENGVPQQITYFAKTPYPLTLALLIDSSGSMDQAMTTAQEAAVGFTRRLAPGDLATIIDFDTRVETLQGFTSDPQALEAAIRRTQAGGSTSLFNALYIALSELGKTTRAPESQTSRRRAIILLSDGDDTSSLVSFEEVLEAASRSDTVIYTIGLGVIPGNTVRSASQDGAFVLRRLAERSGGRAFFPKEATDLAEVYGDIRDELSSQYSLAYESSSALNKGEWRSVVVRVKRPSAMARTRQGYFAPRK